MEFRTAFELMKQGEKVKLPSWAGFWVWDPEKETIMMHCKEGTVLDIRQTDRVLYTITNIMSDEWVVATEKNTPLLGGSVTFGFEEAIKYIKRGFKMKRKGWNGKDQYVELASDISYRSPLGDIINAEHDTIGNKAIAFNGTSGVQMGWLASQADMLATDWMFA